MGFPKENRKRSRPEVEEAMALAMADVDTTTVTPTAKKARKEERRSLFVRSLPPGVTNEKLAEFFSEYFPVKHAVVVVDQKTKESRGFGFVTLADADDAKEAKTVFDKKRWDGRVIRVDVAEPRQRDASKSDEPPRPKPGKPEMGPPPKLIVRNLPWSIKTAEQLSHLFRSYGKVKYADLPKSKGLMKGFGFVTLRGKKNAEKALEGINGKEIDGRTLAVDWAVDKKTWDDQQEKEEEAAQDDEDEEQDDEDNEDDADEDEDEDNEDGGAKTKDTELDADLENFMKNHMQNMEDEDEDEDGDEDEEEAENKTRPAPQRSTDNSTTAFIRNLPFTATDEQLKDFFSNFGPVRYARVVIDKASDRPAGTGFVCFANLDDCKACIKAAPRPPPSAKSTILYDENADPTGKYTMDGRILKVAQAVNREEANDLAQNSLAQRREKDKRRLYLLSEGTIGRNTALFNLLTESEIQMRQASSAQRKKLVQGNPTLHVSMTRIALRNVPRNIDSKALKELARKAVVEFAKEVKEGKRLPLSKEENARDGKDAKEKEHQRKVKGKGIVKQAKIVFESNQGSKVAESTGAGKSRGYGFVEYVSHHWALMGLRYLNGLQLTDDNGKKQRIIAEFSIENAQVVQRRRANEEKSRQPQAESEKAEEPVEEVEEPTPRGRKGGKKHTLKEKNGGDGHEQEEAKDDMKQKLIARKRLMRKKKAKGRN